MVQTVPPSFVEIGQKLRVGTPLSWHKPKTAKNIWCPIGGSVGGCGARAVSRKTPIYFTRISLNQRCFWFSSLGSLFYHVFRYSTVTKQVHRPAGISSRAVQHSIFIIIDLSIDINYHWIIIRSFNIIQYSCLFRMARFFYIRGGCETPRQSRNLSHLLIYHLRLIIKNYCISAW